MELLTSEYWEGRYLNSETGWDIGYASTPIKEYFEKVTDKNLKILIPGAGNAYEAEFFFQAGFFNTWVVDWAEAPLVNLVDRCPDFPKSQLLQMDFFGMEERGFDIIVEQTFFCALEPALRKAYAHKMAELLRENGKLVGVLFDAPLNHDRPPFGGSEEDYIPVFQPYFDFHTFERCYNSIPPRKGRELFIELQKKNVL